MSDNSNKIILDLCGGSGSWARPYKQAGYDIKTITLPDYNVLDYSINETDIVFKPNNLIAAELLIPIKNIYGILAAPPCQSFSIVARNKGSAEKNTKYCQKEGVQIVNACLEIINQCKPKFWALENPTGELRKFIGKPKFTFQPYEFGDGWTKKTDIWGEFNLPQRIYNFESCPKVEQLYTRKTRTAPSIVYSHINQILEVPQLSWAKCYCRTDADARAITPPAFARAFFEANK